VPREGTVLAAGDAPHYVGVLLSGEVHIVHDDYWGNRSILSAVLPGDVFGEAFAQQYFFLCIGHVPASFSYCSHCTPPAPKLQAHVKKKTERSAVEREANKMKHTNYEQPTLARITLAATDILLTSGGGEAYAHA